MLQYKGYRASYRFNPLTLRLDGRVVDLPSGAIEFCAAAVEELQQGLEEAVDAYLEACEREGVEPLRPGEPSADAPPLPPPSPLHSS